MKHQWLAHTGTKDLILVFAGWALGAAPFAGLIGAQDIMLVEDYRQLDTPLPALAHYDRITLIAFSFGVASAAHWLHQTGVHPDRLIAVSGTLKPADAEYGIAPDMIRATADQLTSDSFAKFCRRAGLQGPAPEIDITAAQDELHAVIDRGATSDLTFDRIWIPQKDRIIPTRAQEAAWQAQSDAVRTLPGGHVPFQPGQSWEGWIA